MNEPKLNESLCSVRIFPEFLSSPFLFCMERNGDLSRGGMTRMVSHVFPFRFHV
jgi:hypothetical protein